MIFPASGLLRDCVQEISGTRAHGPGLNQNHNKTIEFQRQP